MNSTQKLIRIGLGAFVLGYFAIFGTGFIESNTAYFDILMDVFCPVAYLFRPPWSWAMILGVIAPLDGFVYATVLLTAYLIYLRFNEQRA